MAEPKSAPSDPGSDPLHPALLQFIARAREAIAAGLPTDEIEREIADRFPVQSAALIALLRAMRATGPNPKPLPAPAQVSQRPTGETWTMSGPVTWTSPTVDGSNSRFGRFELLERLGAGGSGVVFKARDPQLGRLVALKVARAETLFSQEAKLRFTREARLLAAMRHPNIIPLYEAGEANGLPYLVQELCDGPNLAAWLRQEYEAERPVPIALATRWALLTAKGVAHAHSVGIVHRDLKPANVLLEPPPHLEGPPLDESRLAESYVPRITDFGIAKLFGAPENVTATVAVMGTATYMAPEQAEGKTREVDAPADVYSLGVMLYEMLTGRRPIEGLTDMDTLRRLGSEEPPPPSQLRRDVPRDLDAICLKCLEKDPERRYATAGALAQDLERLIAGLPVLARPIGWIRRAGKAYRRQRRSIRVVATSLLITALAGLLLLQRWPKNGASAADPAASYTSDIRSAFNLWNENAERLRDNPQAGDEMEALLRRHIPVPGQRDRRSFDWHYLWRLCHPAQAVGVLPKVVSLTGHTDDVYFVAFSRDSSRIASAGRDKTARIWDVAKGRQVCVCTGHAHDVNWVDFSPDRSLLATASEDHTVKIWDAQTGKERFTLKGHASEVVCVLFDPTGKLLVSADHQGVLKLWDLATKGVLKSVSGHTGRIQGLAWAEDGHLLASVGDDEFLRFWSMPGLSSNGGQRAAGAHATALSRDVEMIALAGGGTIQVRDVRTGGVRSIISQHLHHLESVRFSPDGRQIASCAGDGMLRIWDLASRQGWTAAPPRLINSPSGGRSPVGLWCVAYSPDGRRLATSARDGRIEVFDSSVMPQWTRFPKNKTQGPLAAFVFSTDGSRFAVAHHSNNERPGGFQIWDVSGTRPVMISDVPGGDAFSVGFSRNQSELAIGLAGMVEVIDLRSGGVQSQIQLPPQWAAFKVHIAGDGTLYVAKGPIGRDELFVSAYDASSGREIKSLNQRFTTSGANGMAFNALENLMAAFHPENTSVVSLYEMPGFKLRSNKLAHRAVNNEVAFSPSEPILAISAEGGVELWDTSTCQEIGFLEGLSQINGPVGFSADGRVVFAISPEQRAVHLWDVDEMRELFTLPLPHEQSFPTREWHLAVAPTGQTVAVSTTDKEANVNIYLYRGLSSTSDDADAAAGTIE